MHVLILNQTFYPEHAATAQLMWDLARHLRRAGHRVTAITSRNIYGTDQRHERAQEIVEGVEIRRVIGTRFGKKHLAGRMSDFLSFYAAAFWEMRRMGKPDVTLALTSPPMIAALGVLERRFTRRRPRLVYHVMDLYPDAAVAMDVMRAGSAGHRVMKRLTRRTLLSSDAVIVLGRDMRQRIVREYAVGHHAQSIHVVPPWADGEALRPVARSDNPLARELGVEQTFNIVYSGNLGMAHDVDTLAAAMEAMQHDPGVQWLFIGGGGRYDELRGRVRHFANVRFLPYQHRDDLIHSLNLADVHLVTQLPAFTGIVVPSKLYGIMAVGRPAVMVGPAEVECSLVINEAGCGFVVPNGESGLLVRRLRELQADAALRQEMGRRARQVFAARYDRSIACARIEGILSGVAKNPVAATVDL
jgi:glycosyltransferase involved in cell wall biosynthesis